jgi:hypothetical protein
MSPEPRETIEELKDDVSTEISSIGSQLGWADFKLGDTEDSMTAIKQMVLGLRSEISESSKRQLSILGHLSIADPVRELALLNLKEKMVRDLRDKPSVVAHLKSSGARVEITAPDFGSIRYTKEEIEAALRYAIDVIAEQ